MSEECGEEIIDPEWANLFREEVHGEQSLEEVLREVSIFSLLDRREFRRLARIVHRRHYVAGEIVIRRRVPQSGFYLIRSGSVEIVGYEADGSPEVIDVLGSGELLGEFALVDDTPRSTSIIAAEASELIGFFKPDLLDILDTRPSTGCKILLRLAEEMARTLKRDYDRLLAHGFEPSPEWEPPSADEGGELS